MELYIVFTDSEIVLTKQQYESWRELQNDFFNYKSSLGPWQENLVIDYLNSHYPDLSPSAQLQVTALITSGHFEVPLKMSQNDK